MAAPPQDPNAANPPLGGGVEELFEEIDDVDDEMHAHARAGTEEKKESVQLEDSTLVGFLPKKLTDKQLDAPTAVVELTLKMIKNAVDDDVLTSVCWKKASVMRVGYSNAVNGLVTVPVPKAMPREEVNFIAGDPGPNTRRLPLSHVSQVRCLRRLPL